MINENMGPSEEEKQTEPPKILTKPLPQILDEIEGSIRAINEATKLASAAAKDARQAAEEARQAGEKAASEASKVAIESIARIEDIANAAKKMAELVGLAVADAAASAQKRLTEQESIIESKKKGKP